MQFISSKEAVKLIKDGSSIGTVGFLLTGATEEMFVRIEESFLETGSPKNLSIIWASGIGDGSNRGINHLAHEGLISRAVGGHYGLIPKLGKLVAENKVQGYNLPQGVLTAMFREMAAKRPGVLTTVGLGTFVDPDYSGGKLNESTKEDIVKKIEIEGQEYLLYKSQKIDVALIRGTEADDIGNIGYAEEALKLENIEAAMAAKNNGGIVIAQVKRRVKNGDIDPRNILVPGAFVDYIVVVDDEKNHMQTGQTDFNKDFITISNEESTAEVKNASLSAKLVIGRRCAQFIDEKCKIVNYGIGLPEYIPVVLNEKGLGGNITCTIEPGVLGGKAQGGLDFGSSINPQSIISHADKFNFYDGGGIDCTFLGMAECNSDGSINVSKFGPKIPGCGGFINISQNAKKVVFCGTFTAGGLETGFENGELQILVEGKNKKFVEEVEQITFNGKYESVKGKEIFLVTERAVFEIKKEGLTLVEIAPGVDLQKDILDNMNFKPVIAADLKVMDKELFM